LTNIGGPPSSSNQFGEGSDTAPSPESADEPAVEAPEDSATEGEVGKEVEVGDGAATAAVVPVANAEQAATTSPAETGVVPQDPPAEAIPAPSVDRGEPGGAAWVALA
jgi:hypothetical protein